jgi:hypothetical protein
MQEEPERPMVIRSETSQAPVTISFVPRVLEMYSITEPELDAVSSPFNSVNLAFFGLSFGAALAVLVTLFTVDIDGKPFGAFVAAAIVSVMAVLYFGIQAARDHYRSAQMTDRIKRRTSPEF